MTDVKPSRLKKFGMFAGKMSLVAATAALLAGGMSSPASASPAPRVVDAYFGADIYTTMVNASISKSTVGKPLVIGVGGGTTSLIAAPVVAKLGANALLTKPDSLPANVLAEAQRLNPSEVIVIGSVNATVGNALKALAPTKYTNLNGGSASSTSIQVAQAYFGTATTAFLMDPITNTDSQIRAESANAASAAALQKAPIIFQLGNKVNRESAPYLTGGNLTKIKAVGPFTAPYITALTSPTRTVERVANLYDPIDQNISTVNYVLGATAPTGFVLAENRFDNSSLVTATLVSAKLGSPLLLTNSGCVMNKTQTVLGAYPAAKVVYAAGGTDFNPSLHTTSCGY